MHKMTRTKKLLGILSLALCFGAGNALAAEYNIKIAYENNPGEP